MKSRRRTAEVVVMCAAAGEDAPAAVSRRLIRRGLLGACVLGTTSYLLVLCALSFRELSPPMQQTASKQEPQQQRQQQLLHVCVATDEPEPDGLIALANSTIVHASATSREVLRFHVICPAATRKRLRLVLEALFPSASFRLYTLEIGGVRAKIVRHLRRHEREAVLVSPYRYAHAYLPSLSGLGARCGQRRRGCSRRRVVAMCRPMGGLCAPCCAHSRLACTDDGGSAACRIGCGCGGRSRRSTRRGGHNRCRDTAP